VGQAIRKGTASPALVLAATQQMMALNDRACEVGLALGATSCTDVTGFGLLGHLGNILDASDLDAVVDAASVPLIDGTLDLAAEGVIPGGSKRNLDRALETADIGGGVGEPLQILLADAQTSGGLLLCLPEANAVEAVRRLHGADCPRAAIVGHLARRAGGARVRVV
jgi:selenide,water dikinase